MRAEFVAFAWMLSCSTPSAQPALCDLNEINKPIARFGWNESRTELVEKPVTPQLVVCSCKIDPFLASIPNRDAKIDAQSDLAAGDPHFLSMPDLGGIVSFGSQIDLASLPNLPSRQVPGTDETAECYERERLERLARDYAQTYNETMADLSSSH